MILKATRKSLLNDQQNDRDVDRKDNQDQIYSNNTSFQKMVQYIFSSVDDQRMGGKLKESKGERENIKSFYLLEDTNMVDGIGGITWEGALVLGHFLELLNQTSTSGRKKDMCFLELGAGNGLVSLLLHQLGYDVTATDRTIDLIETNYSLLKQNMFPSNPQQIAEMKLLDDQLLNSFTDLKIQFSNSDTLSKKLEIRSLDWQYDFPDLSAGQSSLPSSCDIILGSEITCLKKQHPYLTQILFHYALKNPHLVIFLTFDDIPNKDQPPSKYEKEFIELMKKQSFYSAIIYTGKIQWQKNSLQEKKDNYFKQLGIPSSSSSSSADKDVQHEAYLQDVTLQYDHDLDWLSIPNNLYLSTSSPSSLKKKRKQNPSFSDELPASPVVAMDVHADGKDENLNTAIDSVHYHHITAFFRPTAINTCSRCHKQFFRMNSLLNDDHLCCYHGGYYVCRRHPAEIRLSIDGQGDSLGYYGNGKEGWAAKFWDCCGNEDEHAMGCRKGPHQLY